MKKLMNLKGVKALNKKQQKEIFGGDDFTHAPPQDGGGGGDEWYCGCNDGGDNQPVMSCNYISCGSACVGHGGWNRVCISAG